MRIIKNRRRSVIAGRSFEKEHKYTVRTSKAAKSRKTIKAEINLKSDTEKSDNLKYLTVLADGVLKEINTQYEGIGELTYDISDTVITFSIDSEVIFIQPIDQIIPKLSDLNDDIMDLVESVVKELDNT